MTSRAPLIVAIVLLLLPLLYVGSYLALVTPGLGRYRIAEEPHGNYYRGYRNGGDWAWRVYWPLEQIDRKVRPEAWAFETYRHSTGEWPSNYRPESTRIPNENGTA